MVDELGNLTRIGDAGIAVAVLIVVAVGFWAIRGIALAWFGYARERSKDAYDLELKRIEADKEREQADAKATQANADALTALKNRMVADAKRQDLIEATTRNLITSSKQLAGLIESVTDRMAERSGVLDQKLDALHTDVKTVPAEVWRIGDPKFDAVLGVLNAMEARLLAKLKPEAEIARAVIREEFGDLISRVRLIVEYLELEQVDHQRGGAPKIESDYLNKSEYIRPAVERYQVSQIRHQADGCPDSTDAQKDDPQLDPDGAPASADTQKDDPQLTGGQVIDQKPPETPKPGEHV